MINDFAVIDFETYYDNAYSLSKMSIDEYVLDGRFEIIGVGLKRSRSSDVEWMSGSLDQVRAWLSSALDWSHTAVCAHHAQFDGFICTQRLGLKPKLWLDTLSMGRALYSWLASHSLASLANVTGIGAKGSEVYNAIGKRRADFSCAELEAYGEYCRNDVALTSTLASLFLDGFPLQELAIIDMTIRMFTEPKLMGDVGLLDEYYHEEVATKEQLLQSANVQRDVIMSNNKFAALLQSLGVSPPMKISPRTNKSTWAFSKSDAEFTALLNHEDIRVQTVVAARLGVKTTIAETRAIKLRDTAARGPMPVYLKYWGAKTTGRMSGGENVNWQNIPARGPGAKLRKAIVAPPGHSIVVGDSSNIELRVAMACAGETEELAKIVDGVDLYCDFASKLYGRTITKEDKTERLLGKIAKLSLQYGAGAQKFVEMVRMVAKIDLLLNEAKQIVDLYRALHPRVVELWWYCGDTVLKSIANNAVLTPVDVNGWVLTTSNGFSIPGHLGVVYNNLHKVSTEWFYSSGVSSNKSAKPVKLYGGKVVENLCQHLARHIVLWQTARINREFPVALSVHDEVVCVVPDNKVADCVEYMKECLSLAPPWCRDGIPLACEVGVGKTYGDAK